MTEREQIQHFEQELDRLVLRFAKEYEMTYASIIGTLFLKAKRLCDDAVNELEE